MSECQHEDFLANVDVTRLEDSGRFAADVRIQCTQCETPFRFIGLPAGCDLNGAATSMDATEARLAIAPKGEVMPAVDGAPHGFSVRIDPDSEKMLPAMRISKLEREIESLRAAVSKHHAQRLDDRCFLDDEDLYAAFGLPPADVSTPPKEKMLANCERFLDQRCKPGSQWKSYQELEAELAAANEELAKFKDHSRCPVCHQQFEMGQPPHFKPEESGEGHDGERAVHWVSGTQTCPECGATWPYGDSD